VNDGIAYIIEAECVAAIGTDEMDVVIVVMAFGAIFTQRITNGVVGGGYDMNDPFLDKSLQSAVDSYPVEFLSRLSFNVTMRKSVVHTQKKI
jgi:hypothetical protein